jgi:hypothetical protein
MLLKVLAVKDKSSLICLIYMFDGIVTMLSNFAGI